MINLCLELRERNIFSHAAAVARKLRRNSSGVRCTVARWESQVCGDGRATPARGTRSAVARVTGPLGPRRAVGDALRKLREDRGKSLSDVAGDLTTMSTSKQSRLENAQGTPLPRDIKDLIAYYEIQGTPLAASLERWTRAAGRRGWWTDYDDEVTEGLDAHLAYEVDAAVERVYTLPFLPALLQTQDYARAVFRDMEERTPEQTRQLLEVRERRQEALKRRDGPGKFQLIAVTYESTLHQQVGSPGIMREQLGRLAEHAAAPNVNLHVLPFTARPAFSMTCMYALFEYQDAGESDIVNVETHAGYFSVEPERVARYRSAHDALVRASLSEEASLELILRIRDSPRGYG
jgi:transcriptional regulator with XRE-family HTH domain